MSALCAQCGGKLTPKNQNAPGTTEDLWLAIVPCIAGPITPLDAKVLRAVLARMPLSVANRYVGHGFRNVAEFLAMLAWDICTP